MACEPSFVDAWCLVQHLHAFANSTYHREPRVMNDRTMCGQMILGCENDTCHVLCGRSLNRDIRVAMSMVEQG